MNIVGRFKQYFTSILFVALIYSPILSFSQDRITQIEQQLNKLASEVPALNSKVNLSVSGASIQELVRGIAVSNGVNVNIDPALNINIVNNFADVKVVDVLIFLCKEYNLDVSVTGSIISLKKSEEIINRKPYIAKELKIEYQPENKLLTIDLQNDSLARVAKEITNITNHNIILAPGLDDVLVSAYIVNMPFKNVMDKLAYANNLEINETKDGFILIEKKEEKKEIVSGRQITSRTRSTSSSSKGNENEQMVFDYRIIDDSVLIVAENVPFTKLIAEVSKDLGKSYFLASDIEGSVSFRAAKIAYEDLLENIFNGTSYTYKVDKEIYVIGDNKIQELKTFKVLSLQYRAVEKILEFIPDELTKDIEIKEFGELNSLLINGNVNRVENLVKFINEIDQLVPVVFIEVIITDISKSRTLSTGIEAGLGESQITTGGTIAPSVDFQLNSNSINNLVNSFNGFGWINLGKVKPDFYLSLKALEDDGILKVRSTPKLSTLNGHEASMKIGNTEYYLEENSDVIGTQNPQLRTTQKYVPVDADLSIVVKPFVSGNDQITMEIEVTQSDFTDRISKFAPPGKVTRNFKSSIRIKDQETILLGGLEDKKSTSSGSGLPFLSRIPVIKWIFSSRTKRDENSKLNIFIKPTVIR